MNELKNENLRIETYQLSELLVNDPGQPANWTKVPSAQVMRIGLSSEIMNVTNYLSKDKINAFNTNCSSDYDRIRRLVGTEYNFLITINDTNQGLTLATCKPTVSSYSGTNVSISRIVAFDDGSFGNLNIWLW
jgi:hypothetical protein